MKSINNRGPAPLIGARVNISGQSHDWGTVINLPTSNCQHYQVRLDSHVLSAKAIDTTPTIELVDVLSDDIIAFNNPWIVCAAMYLKDIDLIIPGARHWDKIMNKLVSNLKYDNVCLRGDTVIDGFIDQFQRFHTREEAMYIVNHNGQGYNAERNGSDTKLYSEGLY